MEIIGYDWLGKSLNIVIDDVEYNIYFNEYINNQDPKIVSVNDYGDGLVVHKLNDEERLIFGNKYGKTLVEIFKKLQELRLFYFDK